MYDASYRGVGCICHTTNFIRHVVCPETIRYDTKRLYTNVVLQVSNFNHRHHRNDRHPTFRQRMGEISRDQVPARRQLALNLFLAGNSIFSFKNRTFPPSFTLNKLDFKHTNYFKFYLITSFNHSRASLNSFFSLKFHKTIKNSENIRHV